MPFVSGVYSLPAGYDIPIVANSALGMRWSYDTMHDIEQSISGIIAVQTLNASPASGDFLLSEVAAGTSLQKVTIGSLAAGINHDALAGLQGGTAGEFFHLTSAEYTGTGTGVFARMVSPLFTTPNIGAAIGISLQLTGQAGIGGAANPFDKVTIAGTLPSSSATSIGIDIAATVPSTSTTQYRAFLSNSTTQAAAFTITDFNGFRAANTAKGAGSTITTYVGFSADDLTQGTNNYGFQSTLSSGANKWNFYDSGTANNAFAGNVRVGSVVAPTVALDITGAALISSTLGVTGLITGSISGNAGTATALQTPRAINTVNFDGTAPITVTAAAGTLTGATLAAGVTASSLTSLGSLTSLTVTGSVGIGGAPTAAAKVFIQGTLPTASNVSYAIYNAPVIPAGATTEYSTIVSTPTTAAALALASLSHFNIADVALGGGSTVTLQTAYSCNPLTSGATNYGFRGLVAAAAGRFNLFMDGTADNAVAGNFRIGSTTAPTVALDVTGAAKISTTLAVTGIATHTASIVPAANGVPALGSANVGWKGVYLDYTNTGTVGAVTINKPAGRVNIAATGTSVVVTNSIVTAASHVFVQKSESTSTGGVVANVVPGAGSFTINVTAVVGATASYDFLVINAD